MSLWTDSDSERVALLNLWTLDGVGAGTLIRLIEQFGTAEEVFRQSEAKLQTVPKINSAVIARIRAARPDHPEGKRLLRQAAETNVEIRTYWDADYPPKLRELETDAPVILFLRGTLPSEARRLAVVGTRSATAYGRRIAHDLIIGLRGSGFQIVSGLASGIDGFAHEAALEAGLTTEAVFGCGVDRVYPPANTALANRILAAGGTLISEYPLGTPPDRHHFPQRNRIIAGLCEGTLVVEAGAKSGALITAMLAVEYGREVMAVPGAVNNPKSSGCHALLKNGAALIEKAEDILETLNVTLRAQGTVTKQVPLDLAPPESELMKLLDATEAVHIDVLALKAQMPVGEALGQLLLLELKGAIKQLPGKYFVRA